MNKQQRIVDHLVLMVTKDQQQQLIDRLQAAGFPAGDLVMEENFDLQSYLAPIGGGGFLELSALRSPERDSPLPGVIEGSKRDVLQKTPRAMNVTYTTMDAAADLAAWRALGLKDAFAVCGNWRRQDGTLGCWTGISPMKIALQPFFVLQERRLFPLPYLQHAATAPHLRQVVVTGADARLWLQRHIDWFGFSARNGSVQVGDTEIVFREAANPGVEFTYVFDVPRGKGTIPLVGGAIELV